MGCDGVIYGLTQLGDLFTVRDGKLVSIAAGTGEMDYTRVLRFMKVCGQQLRV